MQSDAHHTFHLAERDGYIVLLLLRKRHSRSDLNAAQRLALKTDTGRGFHLGERDEYIDFSLIRREVLELAGLKPRFGWVIRYILP